MTQILKKHLGRRLIIGETTEAQPGLFKTSKMKNFVTIVNDFAFQALTIAVKLSILNVSRVLSTHLDCQDFLSDTTLLMNLFLNFLYILTKVFKLNFLKSKLSSLQLWNHIFYTKKEPWGKRRKLEFKNLYFEKLVMLESYGIPIKTSVTDAF